MEPLHADLFVIGFGKAGKTVAAAHGRRFCKLGCILQGSSTIAGYVRVAESASAAVRSERSTRTAGTAAIPLHPADAFGLRV